MKNIIDNFKFFLPTSMSFMSFESKGIAFKVWFICVFPFKFYGYHRLMTKDL